MKEEHIERLKQLMSFANELGWVEPNPKKSYPRWVEPNPKKSYPQMQCSDIEKLMLAMVDDDEYSRIANWVIDKLKENKPC